MSEGRATAAPLAPALEALRLDGAIFFRAEYSEPWSYESPVGLERVLRPGSQRLIYFHVVAAGRCWIRVGDGDAHWASTGDVIVLPYGAQHAVGGVDDADMVPITSLLEPPPWASMPVLRYGGGGSRTDIICGYLHSDDPLFDPTFAAFPPVFVVRPPSGPAAEFVQASIQWALATSSGYEPDWSVAELASRVAVSRSLLDQRFRKLLGRPPIRYLAEWRMHLATDLLATTELPVVQIARRVGYESEEAFSRAFKRSTDIPPSVWRLEHATPRSPQSVDTS